MRASSGARTVLVAGCLAGVWMCRPLTAAGEAGRSLYAGDGRVLRSEAGFVWLAERPGVDHVAASEGQTGVTLLPIDDAMRAPGDADDVVMRLDDGRYLARFHGLPYLTPYRAAAAVWRLIRAAGPGALAVGDGFELYTRDGLHALSAQHGSLALTRSDETATTWSFGCGFARGPYTRRWLSAARFDVDTGMYAAQVEGAVAWLREHAVSVRLPAGDLPLLVWDDPTLEPEPAVAYLMIDTLWAAKALGPYDPDLAEALEQALLSLGWYGNDLADTLFHTVTTPAHLAVSTDWVHGTRLDVCEVVGGGATGMTRVQLRVPEQRVDPAWAGSSSRQFVDSAVYTALSDYWNGAVERARARIRDILADTRASGGDLMFWDEERRWLVDQASRCDYDGTLGRCSEACPRCAPCGDAGCVFYVATYKLALLHYAARVTGLSEEPALAEPLAEIAHRLWQGQLADGGMPHLMFYLPDGAFLVSSAATGEASAIAVLSESVVVP